MFTRLHALKSVVFKTSLPKQNILIANIKMLHDYKLTPNINLYSENTLHKNEINQNKPLVIIMSWMMGKRKHLQRYTEIYIDKGCDVLTVNITPWQLMWPTSGSQIVAKELVNILEHVKMPLLVHGFSVGAYVWAEALLMLGPNHPVLSRIYGQVWDSAADFATIGHGLSFAMFPNNFIARNMLKYYIKFHTILFHYFSVVHYRKAKNHFFNGALRAPMLIFCSENDLIGTASENRVLMNGFEERGIPVRMKCWEKSAHVMHLTIHNEEYMHELNKFLDEIGFPPLPKAKL